MSFNRKKKIRLAVAFIFFSTYISTLAYLVFFSSYRKGVHGIIDYNFIPFRSIINYISNFNGPHFWMLTDNLFGNIIAFIPFGFFLPFFSVRCKKLLWIVFVLSLCSLMIETNQLIFRRGAFDIDDIILNTIGGLIGYLIWRFIKVET